MTIKTQLVSIVFVLVILAALFIRNPVNSNTIGRLTVVEETETFVLVRAGDQVGRLYKEFSFDFSAPNIDAWFFEEGWNAMTLQSPAVQGAEEAVWLGQNIINGTASFIDNRISADNGAARFEAKAPANGMVTSKADIMTTRMWFANGDDLWFQGRFFMEQGVPYSLVDFEDNNTNGNPGIRIVVDGNRFIGIELKAGGKPRLRQSDVEIPLGRWFELTVHMQLDERSGKVRIWQDDVLIIDGEMKTFPTIGALYNSLEIGITATDGAAIMLVDDVVMSHNPL